MSENEQPKKPKTDTSGIASPKFISGNRGGSSILSLIDALGAQELDDKMKEKIVALLPSTKQIRKNTEGQIVRRLGAKLPNVVVKKTVETNRLRTHFHLHIPSGEGETENLSERILSFSCNFDKDGQLVCIDNGHATPCKGDSIKSIIEDCQFELNSKAWSDSFNRVKHSLRLIPYGNSYYSWKAENTQILSLYLKIARDSGQRSAAFLPCVAGKGVMGEILRDSLSDMIQGVLVDALDALKNPSKIRESRSLEKMTQLADYAEMIKTLKDQIGGALDHVENHLEGAKKLWNKMQSNKEENARFVYLTQKGWAGYEELKQKMMHSKEKNPLGDFTSLMSVLQALAEQPMQPYNPKFTSINGWDLCLNYGYLAITESAK